MGGRSITTDDVIDLIAEQIHEVRPDWGTYEECRATVSLARRTIELNPDRFLDTFFDSFNALRESR